MLLRASAKSSKALAMRLMPYMTRLPSLATGSRTSYSSSWWGASQQEVNPPQEDLMSAPLSLIASPEERRFPAMVLMKSGEAVGTGNVAGLILPSASVRRPSCCSVVNGSFATQGARGSEGTKDLRGRGGRDRGVRRGGLHFQGVRFPGVEAAAGPRRRSPGIPTPSPPDR